MTRSNKTWTQTQIKRHRQAGKQSIQGSSINRKQVLIDGALMYDYDGTDRA